MKVIIQLGEKSWNFDDGEGSGTILEYAVDSISDLLKSIFPNEMGGERLVVLDEEFADHLLSMDEELDMEDEEEHLCDEHKHLGKIKDNGKNKMGPTEN